MIYGAEGLSFFVHDLLLSNPFPVWLFDPTLTEPTLRINSATARLLSYKICSYYSANSTFNPLLPEFFLFS